MWLCVSEWTTGYTHTKDGASSFFVRVLCLCCVQKMCCKIAWNRMLRKMNQSTAYGTMWCDILQRQNTYGPMTVVKVISNSNRLDLRVFSKEQWFSDVIEVLSVLSSTRVSPHLSKIANGPLPNWSKSEGKESDLKVHSNGNSCRRLYRFSAMQMQWWNVTINYAINPSQYNGSILSEVITTFTKWSNVRRTHKIMVLVRSGGVHTPVSARQ